MGGCFKKEKAPPPAPLHRGKSPTPGPSPVGRGAVCFATCEVILIINSKKYIANSAYHSPPCGGGAGGGALWGLYYSVYFFVAPA